MPNNILEEIIKKKISKIDILKKKFNPIYQTIKLRLLLRLKKLALLQV